MNRLVQTDYGVICLSPRETLQAIDYFRGQLAKQQPVDQLATVERIRELKINLDPARDSFERYAMPDASPGWMPDP